MKFLSKLLIIVILTLCWTLLFDFTFWYLFATKDIEKEYRIQHKVYHHTLKSNFSSNEATWHRKYKICTDSRGFKFDCKSSELNKYDFAFIGDSFIEGIGFPYEKTFVGLVDKKSNFKIINLSVSSYSPVIYYYKVREFIKSNLRFDHLVVFMDISDIQDETVVSDCENYVCDNLFLTGIQLSNKDTNFLLTKIKIKIVKMFPLHYQVYYRLKQFVFNKNINTSNPVSIYDYNYDRGGWTYNPNVRFYGNGGVEMGIKNSLLNMEKLYKLLQKNNIKLSLGVYPWPGLILHDEVNSRQVKIWKKFCENKCYEFINLFPPFFNYAKKFSKNETIKKFYINNDVHLNEEGHKFFAENFFSLFGIIGTIK